MTLCDHHPVIPYTRDIFPCPSVTHPYLTFILQSVFESGSSVGIATELRARRSGIESKWGRDFPPVQTGPGAHPASCTIGTGSTPGVKCGRGVLLTTHPLLVPRSWKSRAIPLPTLWATPGLQREHFTFTFITICVGVTASVQILNVLRLLDLPPKTFIVTNFVFVDLLTAVLTNYICSCSLNHRHIRYHLLSQPLLAVNMKGKVTVGSPPCWRFLSSYV